MDGAFAGQLPCATNAEGEITGCRILKWDRAENAYASAVKTPVSPGPEGAGSEQAERWVEDSENQIPAEMTLEPGEGFWIENNSDQTQQVYLCGQVVFDDVVSLGLLPGFNLLGYPYSAAKPVSQTGGLPQPEDRLSTHEDGTYRLAETDSSGNVRWKDPAGSGEESVFAMGEGYVYERTGEDSLIWTEERPYADLFPTGGLPWILDMQVNESGTEIDLVIACTGGEAERLDILCQDVTVKDGFRAKGEWQLADGNIRTHRELKPPDLNELKELYGDEEGAEIFALESARAEADSQIIIIEWTDAGVGFRDRAKVNEVQVRFYAVARGDIDTDGDGLADGHELLLYGSNPAEEDTDRDGMPDGWEVANGLDPAADDADDDPDGDGRTNGEEHREGTRPKYARETNVTFHVDCDVGNDGFSGLSASAWAGDGPKLTIGAALAEAIPGDTVVVHAGVYDEGVDIRGRGINFKIRGNVKLGRNEQ